MNLSLYFINVISKNDLLIAVMCFFYHFDKIWTFICLIFIVLFYCRVTISPDHSPISILKKNSSGDEHYDSSTLPCPQSEPLKRKTYEINPSRQSRDTPTSGGTLQRYYGNWVKSSDSEFANSESTNENHSSSSVSSNPQTRKHMLLQTLQELKQSLQDQSAVLKKSCLQQPL